jgi:hypothetical protein
MCKSVKSAFLKLTPKIQENKKRFMNPFLAGKLRMMEVNR